MANSPEVTVRVAAEIGPLQDGMKQAEQLVAQSTQSMGQAVQRVGLAQKFDDWMAAGTRGAKRLNLALGASATAAAVAAGDIEGAMNSLPGVFGLVAGSAFKLGGAIHEAFTGAKAEAEALAKAVSEIERRSGFKAAARDAERLIAIEQERNELSKIELSKRRELAHVRQQLLTMETEGATAEAVAAVAAQERLIIVRAEEATKREIARLEKEQADIAAKNREEAEKIAEANRKAAEEKRAAIQRAATEAADNMATLAIVREEDEFTRRQLELQQELLEINRERKSLVQQMGDVAADDLIRSRELVAQAKAKIDLDQIATERMKEHGALLDEQRKKERDRIAASQDSLKSELDMRKRMLGETQGVSSFTQSVQTSIGGTFNVANLGAQSAMRSIAEKQAALQTRIAELVAQIARNTTAAEGSIA